MKKILTTVMLLLISSIATAQTSYIKKDSNGVIEETGFIDKDGLKDSVWYSYSNNIITAEAHYTHGVKCGLWKTYHENGAVMYLIPYVNGIKKGDAFFLDPKGALVSSKKY